MSFSGESYRPTFDELDAQTASEEVQNPQAILHLELMRVQNKVGPLLFDAIGEVEMDEMADACEKAGPSPEFPIRFASSIEDKVTQMVIDWRHGRTPSPAALKAIKELYRIGSTYGYDEPLIDVVGRLHRLREMDMSQLREAVPMDQLVEVWHKTAPRRGFFLH